MFVWLSLIIEFCFTNRLLLQRGSALFLTWITDV
jgi:hypothetical protein